MAAVLFSDEDKTITGVGFCVSWDEEAARRLAIEEAHKDAKRQVDSKP
jgi:hypothetical protein